MYLVSYEFDIDIQLYWILELILEDVNGDKDIWLKIIFETF